MKPLSLTDYLCYNPAMENKMLGNKKFSTALRVAKSVVASLGITYIIASVAMTSGCVANSLMFYPPKASYSWDTPGVVRIEMPGGGVTAAVWLENPDSEKILVLFHGNAEDIGQSMSTYQAFYSEGLSVLAVEYPGYGLSEGSPSEKNLYAAADAAFAFLTADKNVAQSNMVIMGKSVGSGPACYLAEKQSGAGGLILQSGFTSAFRTVTRVRILPTDPFPNISRIGNIKCKKLFLHGTKDQVVPYNHAVKLHGKAREPKSLVPVPGAGHNNLTRMMGFEQYVETISSFVLDK